MAHYLRILSRLYNTPLAISQAKFDVISSNVGIKLLTNETIDSIEPTVRTKVPNGPEVSVINVFDSLVAKNGLGASGHTSYESIKNQIDQAIQAKSKSIIFNIASPGGEVNGLFALTDFINSLPKEHGISTSAVIDGSGTSAAYAIASATQKIHATETSIIGSIASIIGLVDQTKLDENMGVKHYILRSKGKKALGNPHEEVTKDVLAKYENLLAEVDTIFNTKVNNYRPNLSINDIIKLEGNDFLAEEAKKLGLIDSIVTSIDDVTKLYRKNKSITLTTTKGMTMTLEEALAKNLELSSELAEVKAERDLAAKQAAKEEQARILGILKASDTLNLDSGIAIKRIKAGTSVEESTSLFEDIAEAVQKANAVDTAAPVTATINKDTVADGPEDFLASIDSAIDALDKQDESVTWGVR